MELRPIINYLLRRWWLAFLPVLVVGTYVAFTFERPQPVYQVAMRFAAGTEAAGLSVDYDRYYPWLTSEYIANALADLAVTEAFAKAVSNRLQSQNITVDPNTVQANVASDNVQSILIIYLNCAEPDQCTVTADAISAELTENATAYFPQIAGVGLPARRLDEPHPTLVAPSLRSRLIGPGLRIALSIALGLALVFLSYYLDPHIYRDQDLESLGVAVMGVVPRTKLSFLKQLLS